MANMKVATQQSSSWYVDTSSMSSTGATFMYKHKQDKDINIAISFGTLPTFVTVNKTNTDPRSFEIQTDAFILRCDTIEQYNLEQDNFYNFKHIPIGMRYGTYTVSQHNMIVYIKEFWKLPSITVLPQDSPEMILVRPRETLTFMVTV